jgi:uncharacterized repeat protein (TIGR02543 family)
MKYGKSSPDVPVSLPGNLARTGGPIHKKRTKKMKKKAWFLRGILGIVLVSGLLLAGCPTDNSGHDNGTTCTVTFDAQGGSVSPSTITVNVGETINVLPTPTRGTDTFGGWFIEDVHGGGMFPFTSSTPVYENITVFALWDGGQGIDPFGGEWTGFIATPYSGDGYAEVSITNGFWSVSWSLGGSLINENGTYTYTGTSAMLFASSGSPFASAYIVPEAGVLMMEITGGVYSGSYGEFTRSSTPPPTNQYTVTFDAQGGSASQSTISVNVGGYVTNLPTAIRIGYTFGGWFTQINGGGSQFTTGTPVNGNITVYAKWISGGSNTGEEGVYIGIISFAGDTADLTNGTPILLDSSGKNSLTSKINSDYVISSQGGTALFYGVHKALANLTNMTTYPDKLDSVNVVTFTDGLDNGSTGRSAINPIEDQTFDTEADYATYVDGQIDSRTIDSKPITAYSVGVRGSDVTNIPLFQSNLEKIASIGKNQELTDFSNLQATFTAIADNLQVVHSNTNFNMKTTLLSSGTKVRMTFDVTGTGSSDAAASSKYLEGTITRTGTGANLTYTFGSITYGGGLGSTQGTGPITGTINGSEVTFAFTGMSGYDPATDESTAKQWTMTSGTTEWQVNSEYSISGATDVQVEKRSAIIYLVLDASTSLNNTQIGQIRSATIEFINSLYNRLNGGSSSGTVPSAPPYITATAQSSSSISVSWGLVSGVTEGYMVYRSTNASSGYTWVYTTSPTTISWMDTGLAASTTYYYRVSAVNSYGESSQSTTGSATTNSSSSSAVTLTNNQWYPNSFTSSSQTHTYQFYATAGTTYRITWDDSYEGSGSYTCDVKVSAVYPSGSSAFNSEDSGYSSPKTVTSPSSGNITITVTPYSSGDTGNYRIQYY